jgi:hypothetical protein
MALTITPGYDFGVNEVPTNTKLKLMLDAMQIAGIPKGSVDSGLAGILYGWLTGSTMATLPDEGSMLYDLNGRLFVKSATGVVSLYQSGFGGYETVRVRCADPLEPTQNNPVGGVDNWYGRIESLTAGNEDFDAVYYRVAASQSKTIFAMNQVTTVSGERVRILLCGGRRSTHLYASGTWRRDTRTGNDRSMARSIEKSTDAVNEWKVTEFPNFNDSSDGLGPCFGVAGQMESNDARAPTFLFGADLMVI